MHTYVLNKNYFAVYIQISMHIFPGFLSKFKKLKFTQKKSTGRNNSGSITVFQKGGGNKNQYYNIDFRRLNAKMSLVLSINRDSYRTAKIAILCSGNKSISFILAVRGLQVGDIVMSGVSSVLKTGNCLPLKKIPIGYEIHNIESSLKNGFKFSRAAGVSSQILNHLSDGKTLIRLSSKEEILLDSCCSATVGFVSYSQKKKKSFFKAGYSRWKNIRPTVRGVAQNPVDHPHGGGEGKSSSGRCSVSPWGKLCKGKITVRKKRSHIFKSRHSID